MKSKNMYITLLLVPLLGTLSKAQSSVAAAGGDSSGSGGNISYSVGQTFYVTKGSNAELTEGVQQPYEILTLATSDVGATEKNISLYPNPVKDILFVDFNEEKFAGAEYQLFDSQGRMIKKGSFSQKKTELDFRLVPQSIYVIQIFQDGKNIKTFKIIKK